MVVKPCAAERTIERESNKLEEATKVMEASSVTLKPCTAGTTTQGESSKVEDAAEPMEVSSVANSYLKKRKAEFEPEEDEESDGEIEESGDGKAKIEEEEAEFDMLMAPEWDVDSFDGLEYYSSDDEPLSEDDDEDDEEAMEHYRIYKRQIIESKGFYVDPELKPICHYKRIRPMRLEKEALDNMTFRKFWEEMVHICLQKLNQDKGLNVEFVEVVRGNYYCGPRSKSYITFVAREKPDGPRVNYQAKSMFTFDGKMHPILCRRAPTPKP